MMQTEYRLRTVVMLAVMKMMAMKMMGMRFCLAKTVTTKKSGCGKKKQKTVHSWSKGLQTV